MHKVFVVGGSNPSLSNWFVRNGFKVTSHPEEANLFQFMGGEDVSPLLYKQENIDSYNNFNRDLKEMAFYAMARRLGIPMAGICRGGQFLNVMCGGSMIQHIDGHTRDHDITTCYGQVIKASSTHHQMMQPGGEDHLLLATANIIGDDPEVVFYINSKCLCFQPHPEYTGYPDLEDYYFKLIKEIV